MKARIILIGSLVSLALLAFNFTSTDVQPKVTFIELGSVKCVPCQKMQTVIKQVKENYPEQVNVIFYDVWTKEEKKYADAYKINLIPTQIFLDEYGKEYYRHEGFFSYEDVEKILKQKL